jgi:hypothetical protein
VGKRIGFQVFTDFIAVHLGHINIQKDQIGGFGFSPHESHFAINDTPYTITLGDEHGREQPQIIGSIVNNEYIS